METLGFPPESAVPVYHGNFLFIKLEKCHNQQMSEDFEYHLLNIPELAVTCFSLDLENTYTGLNKACQ